MPSSAISATCAARAATPKKLIMNTWPRSGTLSVSALHQRVHDAAGNEYPGGDDIDHRHLAERNQEHHQRVEYCRQLELVAEIAGDARDLERFFSAEHEAGIVDLAASDGTGARKGEPRVEHEDPADMGEHGPKNCSCAHATILRPKPELRPFLRRIANARIMRSTSSWNCTPANWTLSISRAS